MSKVSFVLLILFSISKNSFAHDIIVIHEDFYHIDIAKKMILVNRETNWINSEWPDTKTHILLDHYYQFSTPIAETEIGIEYSVTYNSIPFKLFFTELPVISISSSYTFDPDTKVYATFTLTEESGNVTNSNIGIEYRGASTSFYPKKSFLIELWNDTTGNDKKETNLLNMRNDGDWILTAMYNEPLRIRSKTAHAIWLSIHQPYYHNEEIDARSGVRSEYVELFINDEYMGVYQFGERVDRKQLKLKKYDGTIRGELYKGIGWGGSTYTELLSYSNSSHTWNGFEFEHPEEEINWDNLYSFVNFVVNSTDNQFYTYYKDFFKQENAVDYFIFLNTLRAIDNTGKNVYVAKYKKNEPYFFVPWDLDGVLGQSWDGSRLNVTTDLLSNGFYDRLIRDCDQQGFVEKLQERWLQLRSTTLTHNSIMSALSNNHNYLLQNAVYTREKIAWSSYNYEPSELSYMSGWINSRLNYLDNLFSQSCEELRSEKPLQETSSILLRPNPAENYIHLSIEPNQLPVELMILNSSEHLILNTKINEQESDLDLSNLLPGLYLIKFTHANGMQTEKFLKY